MKYLAVLGRQPELSEAELLALLPSAKFLRDDKILKIETAEKISWDFSRLGGVLKIAEEIDKKPLDFLMMLPEGKITFGISDYSRGVNKKTAQMEALKLKKILKRHERSVRVVENKEAVLSVATSLHNGLNGQNEKKVELLKYDEKWYRVVFMQDIDAYAKRDQARPARDAKVGMLPPKLAQILINLCGELPKDARILDPFCGTGVVLQEALLMGYDVYGTDLSARMVEYSQKNLEWLISGDEKKKFMVEVGDATNFEWKGGIDAVVCEGYLGKPMSNIPSEMRLKTEQAECKTIIQGFLKNLAGKIRAGTPVVLAIPAWRRNGETFSRINILDDKLKSWYNEERMSQEGLLYYRENQIVARDIIILRKK